MNNLTKVTTISGPPHSGKTTELLKMSYDECRKGNNVLFVSSETNLKNLISISNNNNIRPDELKCRTINSDIIILETKSFNDIVLFLDRNNIDIVVIDNVYLLEREYKQTILESEEYIILKLQEIAQKYNVSIIISQ